MDRPLKAQQSSADLLRTWVLPLIPLALAVLLIVRHVLASGTWLDEYWQLWVSGAPSAELPARLAGDAHPPWFNLFARPIALVTGGAIIAARLLNLSAAMAVFGLGLWRIQTLEPGVRWRIALLVLASGGAVGMTELAASFRAYPWLLVLASLQAALLAALALERPVPTLLGVLVTTSSIAVHYVHAAGAIAIALVSIAVGWRFQRRSSQAILAGLVLGIAIDLVSGLLQRPHWHAIYDVNWIDMAGGGGAVAALTYVAASFLVGSLVAATLLAIGLISNRSRAVLIVLAPIPIAFIGWLVIEAGAPILVPRYLSSVTALLGVGAAIAWWELAPSAVANMGIAILAALQPLASSIFNPPIAGWEAGARIASDATRACRSSRLYAISPWRFRDHPDSKTAHFENPVIAFAYASVGERFGLKPQFVSGPTMIELDPCPAILWIEAAHGLEGVPLGRLLDRAQLQLPEASTVRIRPTPNGAVLLISRADRLQPQP